MVGLYVIKRASLFRVNRLRFGERSGFGDESDSPGVVCGVWRCFGEDGEGKTRQANKT